MTFVYVMVFGVVGFYLFGWVGVFIGLLAGFSYGATQSNYREIRALREEVELLKKEKSI